MEGLYFLTFSLFFHDAFNGYAYFRIQMDKMNISKGLQERSDGKCEFCSTNEGLNELLVSPKKETDDQNLVVVCQICLSQINAESEMDINHWRCLNDSMWNATPAVQVVSYRMLSRLNGESWAQDAIGMMYMEESTLEWAKQGLNELSIVHKDINGNVLSDGDSVSITQDLNVKGSTITAKRGTAVRRIRLVRDNAEQIEGKVDGQHIVILTKFVKKQ